MSKRKEINESPTADQPPTDTAPAPVEWASHTIVSLRAMSVGEIERAIGEPIAEVRLAPGVSLNFLARAITDHLVGEFDR